MGRVVGVIRRGKGTRWSSVKSDRFTLTEVIFGKEDYMKKVSILLMLGVFAIVTTITVIGYVFVVRKTPHSVKREYLSMMGKTVYYGNITSFMHEYKSMMSTADEKYVGRIVVIVGNIKNIAEGDDGKRWVSLWNFDHRTIVHCEMKGHVNPILDSIQRGETIGVAGTVTRVLLDTPYVTLTLTKCVIEPPYRMYNWRTGPVYGPVYRDLVNKLKVIVPTFLILMMLLILGYIYKNRERLSDKERKKKLNKMMKQCAYDVNMNNILTSYRENEISAREKYTGTIVSITGTVQKITEDLLTPVMSLSTYRGIVRCVMQKIERKWLMELRVGDEVGVYGSIDNCDLELDVLYLKNCLIQLTEEEEQDGSE